MMTLTQIEARQKAIHERVEEIGNLIKNNDGDPIALSLETANLINELSMLRNAIIKQHELIISLAICDCEGGPH